MRSVILRPAALMGRELPQAEVLAADQRITAWARELRAAGLEGDMDVLRARAYLDLLQGKDSRPRQHAGGPGAADGPGSAGGPGGAGQQDPRGGGPGGGPAPRGPDGPGGPGAAGPADGPAPGGFAGRVTLTVPATTLLDLAERPGEIPGTGPVDPDPGANT